MDLSTSGDFHSVREQLMAPTYHWNFPSDYYNRKGWHSILMQGTVNHLGLFMDVYIGWPGRVHGAVCLQIQHGIGRVRMAAASQVDRGYWW